MESILTEGTWWVLSLHHLAKNVLAGDFLQGICHGNGAGHSIGGILQCVHQLMNQLVNAFFFVLIVGVVVITEAADGTVAAAEALIFLGLLLALSSLATAWKPGHPKFF